MTNPKESCSEPVEVLIVHSHGHLFQLFKRIFLMQVIVE